DGYRRDSSWQVAFAEALVDALLNLAAVVPSRVGLADLGHAEGWHARQVARWARQLERYERTDGYRSDLTEEAAQIGRWLTDHPPREHRFWLIHGDFHLANVLFCHDEPALAAIIDWELATQGDPLLDFGQLLATWPVNEHAVDAGPAAPLDDLPGTGVLVERYLAHSGRAVEDVAWFRVLACYRLAILVEGTFSRARAGRADVQLGDEAHERAQILFRQAAALIGTA